MIPQITVNYVAVLVAAIVSMVLGALWYSPVLFGKQWMKLSNIDPKKMPEMKKKAKTSYALNFVAVLVMAYVLAHTVQYAQAATVFEGVQAGFWVWLGFIATVLLGSVLWEGKPWKLYLLNAAHYFVSLVVMGVILTLWA
ncbi:DUF1761 domain-containing protein [Candidatus Woesearchaeota archaeon]|nr:DUF1761 domain-containing protein [Candidatus Woesearchaeota archaeon]